MYLLWKNHGKGRTVFDIEEPPRFIIVATKKLVDSHEMQD